MRDAQRVVRQSFGGTCWTVFSAAAFSAATRFSSASTAALLAATLSAAAGRGKVVKLAEGK